MNNDESFFGTFFGTPVVCTQVKENTDILQSCYKDIGDGKWGRIYEHSNQNKNMGWGYDGKGDMRILESYPQIKKILLDNFTSFMNEIMMINSTKFDISTSWLTRIGKGEQSPMHLHANSFWSGVYYYDEDYDGTSPLTIESPLINHIKDFGFFVQPDEANEYNSLTMDLYPKKNQLLLFPSYLKHGINEQKSEKIRYSLAFNIIPVGHYGGGDSQYNTKWFN